MTIPFTIAADSLRVVVYDAALASITAYSATTGAIEWSTGRGGAGPGEFSTYVTLSRTPSGDFLALDWHNVRLTYLDAATGRVKRFERWRVPGTPLSACVTSDSTVLALTSAPERPLVWFADSTSRLEFAPLPWPALREAHPLVTQAMLAAGPDGDCVLAIRYGQGIARYTLMSDAPVFVRDYVETVPIPEPRREKHNGGTFTTFREGVIKAARAAAIGDDEILIAFAGQSRYRDRIVDRYALEDGTYLGSFLLEHPPTGMAAYNGMLFVIDEGEDYPAIRALAIQKK